MYVNDVSCTVEQRISNITIVNNCKLSTMLIDIRHTQCSKKKNVVHLNMHVCV